MEQETTIKEIARDYWDFKAHAIAILSDESIVVLDSWYAPRRCRSFGSLLYKRHISDSDLQFLVGETPQVARLWFNKMNNPYMNFHGYDILHCSYWSTY